MERWLAQLSTERLHPVINGNRGRDPHSNIRWRSGYPDEEGEENWRTQWRQGQCKKTHWIHLHLSSLLYSNTSASGPTSNTQLPSVHCSCLCICFYSYQHKHFCFWADVGWFLLLLGITVFDFSFWNAYYSSNHCFILAMEKQTAVCKGKVSSTVF